jgi:flagellin
MVGSVSHSTFLLQTHVHRNLDNRNQVLERLATARRINHGKDDPAGLIAASRLQSALASLESETRAVDRLTANANITDGHLTTLSGMTADLRTHVLAAASTGSLVAGELEAHQLQIDQTVERVQRAAFDAESSLDRLGLPDEGRSELAEKLKEASGQLTTLMTGASNELASGNFDKMQEVLDSVTTAFSEARGEIGTYQRYVLEPRARFLQIERENVLSAHSQIVDADFAEETSGLARANVLTESSIRVLQIANHNAKTVLSLLK